MGDKQVFPIASDRHPPQQSGARKAYPLERLIATAIEPVNGHSGGHHSDGQVEAIVGEVEGGDSSRQREILMTVEVRPIVSVNPD